RFTTGDLRQYWSKLSRSSSTPGLNETKFIGAGADWRLFEALLTNLLEILFRDYPACAGSASVKSEKIGPGLLQLEANVLRIGNFYRSHPLLHHVARGATIALERVLEIRSCYWIPIVKFYALVQLEV